MDTIRECDIIICWTDDLAIRNKLPIWELSSIDLSKAEIPSMSPVEKEASYWECRALKAENSLRRMSNLDETKPRPVAVKENVQSRRKEVAVLSKSGHLRQEMADKLGVSLGTVKNDLRIISNGKVD